MVDGVGTNIFTYTGSGQLLTEDGPFASDTITNAYWNRMRTNLTLVQPSGLWTNAFTYDSANRLYSVGSPAGTFTYTYAEPSTRLTSLALPNGAYINNVYDTMSRLTNTFLFSSGGTPLDGYVYQYDRENQRTNEVRADSSTVAYSYDKIGQLTIANSSVNSEDRGYTYDTAWNLSFRTNNGSLSTFVVDNKNELTNAFSVANGYDGNGNLTNANGLHKVYVYDDENRLVQWFSYQVGPSSPASGDYRTDFAYDGLGRLRRRTEYVMVCPPPGNCGPSLNGVQAESAGIDAAGNECVWTGYSITEYIYDGWRVIQERDINNTPVVSYTRGNDLSVSLEGAGGIGGLLARSYGYSSGNWTSHADYYADGNGNITYLLSTNQTMLAKYRYDPFGNIISKSGSLADANVYRFSSKEVHVNSGMYYYGFRFYEPNLQRWVNRDPIGEAGGVNLYGFIANSPLNSVDSFGLDPGDLFASPDDAAKDAACYMKNHPLMAGPDRVEQASAIFKSVDSKDKDKPFYYNKPQHGPADLPPSKSLPDLNTSKDPADPLKGWVHDHLTGENFSSEKDLPKGVKKDKEFSKDLKQPGYLITPSGDIKKYDPATDKTTTIGHCK